MDRERLHKLLCLGFEKGASDIHFQVGYLPLYRFNGELVELRYKVLTPEDTEGIARLLVADTDHEESFEERQEIDLAYEIPSQGRFRVNICRERRCYNIVLRLIPIQIQTFEQLNLPSVLNEIAMVRRGMVLVTGATGMGKSTTLAAMLQEVNRARKCKIITVEDPVEFIFKHERAIITQREVGVDTESYAEALRGAMRQDPDVIMMGEVRDAETVDTALKASETGHAVFSSIHTSDAVGTIHRILSFFPGEAETQVRERIAENLQAIISLRLLPNKKQTGRVPAVEIMRNTRSIQESVRDPGRTIELPNHIAKGREHMNMQTFDQHLLDLYRANKISVEVARAAASNPRDFATQLALEGDEGDQDAADDSLSVQIGDSSRF